MKAGDRFYYTGDMANIEDFGTITKRYQDRWGDFVDVKLDDNREFKRVSIAAFEKGPGQRFKPIEQYNKEREQSLARLKGLMRH